MPSRGSLRSRLISRLPFDPKVLLTPAVRRFFLGTLVSAVGTGFVLPFFVIYCTKIRHFPPIVAAAALAWEAVLGISIAPRYGTLVDRHGPSRVLTICLPLTALAEAGIAFASSIPVLFGISTFFALAGAGMWSAFSTLMARLVAEEHRPDAFGVNFLLLNLGIGVGVVIGGAVANLHSLRSFQVIYLAAAALAVVQAAIWYTLRSHGGPAPAEDREGRETEGWREVLHDHRMVRYVAGSVAMMVCGYGSIEAGLPLFVVSAAHQSTHVVSLIFVFNTVTIVVGQLFALSAIRGRSRSLVLGAVGLCWGVSWLFATASLYVGVVAGAVGLCLGQIVFATGETLFQPVSGALVNALAPEHLRGRYNALSGIIWGVSAAFGQVIAGVFLQFHEALAWTIFVAAGATLGGLGLTTMRRVLTAAEDGRSMPAEPDDASAAAGALSA